MSLLAYMPSGILLGMSSKTSRHVLTSKENKGEALTSLNSIPAACYAWNRARTAGRQRETALGGNKHRTANTAQMGEVAQLLHVAQEAKLAQSLPRRRKKVEKRTLAQNPKCFCYSRRHSRAAWGRLHTSVCCHKQIDSSS